MFNRNIRIKYIVFFDLYAIGSLPSQNMFPAAQTFALLYGLVFLPLINNNMYQYFCFVCDLVRNHSPSLSGPHADTT